MNQNSKLYRWLSGVTALVLMMALLAGCVKNKPEETKNLQTTDPTTQTTTQKADPTQPAPPQPSETDKPTTEPIQTDPTDPPEVVQPSTSNSPSWPDPPDPPAPPKDPSITFPYTIPNTGLVIENIMSYDGIFLENGADTETTGTAAIILKNNSTAAVEYITITLTCNGKQLQFAASDLPAGARLVAMEINEGKYLEGTYTKCDTSIAWLDRLEMSESLVQVTEKENGDLVVTNLTDQNIPMVRVFYKFYLFAGDVYVGGITYSAKLEDLAAGASVTISPSHYVTGASRVVMVRTYSEKA